MCGHIYSVQNISCGVIKSVQRMSSFSHRPPWSTMYLIFVYTLSNEIFFYAIFGYFQRIYFIEIRNHNFARFRKLISFKLSNQLQWFISTFCIDKNWSETSEGTLFCNTYLGMGVYRFPEYSVESTRLTIVAPWEQHLHLHHPCMSACRRSKVA